MTVEYDAAIDEMYALFNLAWLANSAAIAGYVPEVRWPNIEEPSKPDGSKFWARVSSQTVGEPQGGMGACETPYEKRYEAYGLLFVQIFCPKENARSMELGRLLAKLARNAYRGKSTPGGVWFRNVRIQELADEAMFHRFNVVAEYEYDEVG